MQLELTAPSPLPWKYINTRKCNLVLVQARVDVYHLSGLYSKRVQAREDVYHLSGLYSLGLSKYQVRIKLSDVMYFHVVENELIGVFDLSQLNGVFEK